MDAPRAADCFGCAPGHAIEMADVGQEYIQVELKGTPCWVCLPPGQGPAAWVRRRRPVCRLVKALPRGPRGSYFGNRPFGSYFKNRGFWCWCGQLEHGAQASLVAREKVAVRLSLVFFHGLPVSPAQLTEAQQQQQLQAVQSSAC